MHVGAQRFANGFVVDSSYVHRRTIRPAAGDALEQMHFPVLTIVDAAEVRSVAKRPVQRKCRHAQHSFQFVDQLEWRSRRAVQLIHEREYRNAPPPADFEKLQRLRLDAFARVDDHHRGIDGSQHAIRILGEISMARSVEQVDDIVIVFKLQYGGGNGDPPLLLQLHPVARRGPLVLACRDTSRKVHGAAVKQELLGKRRLSCIRMRNNRKGPAARNLARNFRKTSRGRRVNHYQILNW